MASELDELVSHRHVIVGGVRLHVTEAGQGPLVVLLHGFPDYWYSWRRQIPALVEAGYRVLAPNLRGYSRSESPRRVDAYRMASLVADIAGLVRASGADTATLVGHDWGGAVAWATAAAHPESVERLVVCNAPHPTAFRRGLRSPAQLWRSWYFAAFQLPALPRIMLRSRHGAWLRRALRAGSADPDSFSDADLERYVRALLEVGDLQGPINYYRAAGRSFARRGGRLGAREGAGAVGQPVLVLWGERDPTLGRELADPPEDLVPNARIMRFPDASHWVHLDEAQAVNREILGFLAS